MNIDMIVEIRGQSYCWESIFSRECEVKGLYAEGNLEREQVWNS